MKVAILYGSTTGKTEAVADRLQRFFAGSDVLGVADTEPSQLESYEAVLVGTSTWGTGALQEDWNRRLADFPPNCLKGKILAFFGLGDRIAFPDTFCSAALFLEERFGPAASQVLSPPLLLDDDNQGHLTESLITAWVHHLKEKAIDDR